MRRVTGIGGYRVDDLDSLLKVLKESCGNGRREGSAGVPPAVVSI